MSSKLKKREQYYWERVFIDIEVACRTSNPAHLFFAGGSLYLAFSFHTQKEIARFIKEHKDEVDYLKLHIESAESCFTPPIFRQYLNSGIKEQMEMFSEEETVDVSIAAEFSERVIKEVYPERKKKRYYTEEMAFPKGVR